MPSKQRLTELRMVRNGTQRHRSCAGGIVVGDYVCSQTGERIITVKMPPTMPKAKPKKVIKTEPTAPVQA